MTDKWAYHNVQYRTPPVITVIILQKKCGQQIKCQISVEAKAKNQSTIYVILY